MAYTRPSIFDNNLTTPVSATFVGDLLEDAYDQAVRDASNLGPAGDPLFIDVTKNGVKRITDPGGGGAAVANVTAINAIINGLPDDPALASTVIYFPPGIYDFQGLIAPITSHDVMVMGSGMGVTTVRQTAASTTGRFWTIGLVQAGPLADLRPARVTVRDMSIRCLNTPPDQAPAFYVQGALNWTIENIHVNNIAQFLRIGVDEGDDANSHGGYVNNIVGTLADAGGIIIHIRRAASTIIQNCELHVLGGTDDGHSWLLEPMGGQGAGTPNAIEGLRVTNCSVWSFQTTTGQATCMRIDITQGSTTNLWFSDCSFDFADLATVHIYCNPAATNPGYCRYLKLDNCYLGGMGAGDGNRFRISASHVDSFVMSTQLINCMMAMDVAPAVNVLGAGYIKDTQITHCQFIDKDITNVKSAAIIMEKSDFTVIGNVLRGFDENGTNKDAIETNCNYFIETRLDSNGADPNMYTVIGNRAYLVNTGFFNHVNYANHNHGALGRIVRDNYPIDYPSVASAAALNLPPHAEAVSVTGSTTITSIRGPIGRPITLMFTVGAAVTESASIQLSAAFTAGANKTLTLMSTNGATWWEVARSVN